MTEDQGFERLYESIKLVRGKGSRRSSELCVMSFAALLAGEWHTDAPRSASRLVRRFAVSLNDSIPDGQRQLLKPLAPRILGTRDDHDGDRRRLLSQIFDEELAPRMHEDFPERWQALGAEYTSARRRKWDDAVHSAGTLGWSGLATAFEDFLSEPAKKLVKVLALCAAASEESCKADWYWRKGVETLDRLCEIRNSAPPLNAITKVGQMRRRSTGPVGPLAAFTAFSHLARRHGHQHDTTVLPARRLNETAE